MRIPLREAARITIITKVQPFFRVQPMSLSKISVPSINALWELPAGIRQAARQQQMMIAGKTDTL